MENKETIVRETHYTYDENEKLTSMTVNETITNPRYDEDVEDGEVLTGELDVTAEMSAWDIFLTAAAGALLGNLLYHIIHKD